ncbi:MAG: histidine kinase dimerization/phospho-acceptor domain-containing protein [Kangiellaceae bacterium]|jgi:two-component system capsular synthesis sensor histidine kinase RcsC|nr:histidine kinase dimerization/phospho-acceptor domain-containing protein [Kangiellaceae bacterium]
MFEKKKKSEETKDVFIATMSQEFRNPLNSMLCSIDLLKSQGVASLCPNMTLLLESTEHSGQILLHLINNILDASTL